MLTIIASMEQELAGLRRGLRRVGAVTDQDAPQLHVVGVGRRRAEGRLQQLLGSRRVDSRIAHTRAEAAYSLTDRLLLLGFAAAVNPALRTGDLSLPIRYCLGGRGTTEDFLEPDQRMWRRAADAIREAGLPSTQLDSLTVDHLVATPAEKQALRQQYNIGVINMEDYRVAAAAREAEVPFLSVRAVLDTASQRLPTYLSGLAEHPARAITAGVAMPWRVPTLLRLAQQIRLAQERLAQFALSFIGRVQGSEGYMA